MKDKKIKKKAGAHQRDEPTEVNREKGANRKNTLSQAAVKTDTGRIVGKMEVSHHLIYVGKDLGEGNGVNETDEA